MMTDHTPPEHDPLTDRIARALHDENERALATPDSWLIPQHHRAWDDLATGAQAHGRRLAAAVIHALGLTLDTVESDNMDGTTDLHHVVSGLWRERIVSLEVRA